MAETVRIEIPIEAQDKTNPAVANAKRNLEDLGRAAQNAGRSMGSSSSYVSQFERRAQQTERTLRGWLKEKWEIALEAKDKITPVLKAVGSAVRSLAGRAWNITMRVVDFATAPIRGIINLLKNPIFQIGSIMGISFGVKDSIDTFAGFESVMSQVKAVSGATSSEFEKLTAKAKEMGATTKFTAEESAQAFNYMAMAGWKSSDMINGIEGIMSLAAASGEDLGTTSDIVTDALTAFGLDAKDAGHFSDVLATASSNANTNVSMMGETFKYVGAMAGTLGYSIEDTALAIGLMANAGIKSSQAGTELNSLFTRLSVNTNGARDAIEGLGIEFYDEANRARPFKDVLDELRVATADMDDKQKTALANTIAGQRAQAGLLAMLNASEEDYRDLAEAIDHADGAAGRMSRTMLDNLQGSFTLLNSAADGVKIALGERLAPYLRQFADWLTGVMPDIEKGINNFFDWLDPKIEEFREKISEITSSTDFKNADFFGKVHLVWDFISESFLNWWDSTGKPAFARVAEGMGQTIGGALKLGLLTLLGIDISGVVDDGVSIGASFAKGFSEGFDFSLISSKLMEGLGNIFSNAAKLLPGGAQADLSSLLSAGLLMKIGSPILSLGRGLFGGREALGGSSLASYIIGNAGQGTGLLGLGANTAIDLGAGNLAGGASLSAGALSAVGLASIAGGVIGAGTGISGGLDIYNASKENDTRRAAMLRDSGASKLVGVGAGAAAGAAIGSVVPVAGTAVGALIGAGVGGVAGMMSAGDIEAEYEEQVRAEREAAEAEALIAKKAELTGRAVKDVRFEAEKLNDAFKDSNVSAEEFQRMFNDSVAENMRDSFGDITLSMQEIKDLADSIVFGDSIKDVEKFNAAMDEADSTAAQLAADVRQLEKSNWKIGLGFGISEDGLETFKQEADQFVTDAKKYVEDKHYEATLAIRLLSGGEGDTSGLDEAYENLSGKIGRLSDRYQEALSEYMKDGEISTESTTMPNGMRRYSEAEHLEVLQNMMTDEVQKLNDTEVEAQLDAIQIKYGGANMDIDSFQKLQGELKEKLDSQISTYDEALEISLENLKLQFPNGGPEYENAKAELQQWYHNLIAESNLKSETFQLDTIAGAYSDELSSAFGTTDTSKISGILKEKLDTALAIEPDPKEWSSEEIEQWFNLDGLDPTKSSAIQEQLKAVAETIPEQMKTELQTAFNEMDLGEAAETIKNVLGTDISGAIANTDLSQAISNIEVLRSTIESETKSAFSAPIEITQQVNITYETTEINKPTQLSGGAAAPVNVSKDADWRPSYQSGQHANGGFTNGPELSWIGEDGPEAIIPLGAKRRRRGLDLYEQVGRILGIARNAEGGLYGPGIGMSSNTPTPNALNGSDMPFGMNRSSSATMIEGMLLNPESFGKSRGDFEYNTRELSYYLEDKLSKDLSRGGPEPGVSMLDNVSSSQGRNRSTSEDLHLLSTIRVLETAASMPALYSFKSKPGQSAVDIAAGITGEVKSRIETLNNSANVLPPLLNGTTGSKNSVTGSYSMSKGTDLPSILDSGYFKAGAFTIPWDLRQMYRNTSDGFVNRPQLSLIGEDGPEAIIPLGGKMRRRGIDLYQQVGQVFGIASHANGGIFGDLTSGADTSADDSAWFPEKTESFWDNSGKKAGGTSEISTPMPSVNVNVSVTPQFSIEGNNKTGDEIISLIRGHMGDIADELGGEIADKLFLAFENMPLRKGL